MNKTTRLASALCATCVLGANAANAATAFFRPAGGAADGYWDDLGNWWSSESYNAQSSRLPNGADTVLVYAPGVTAIVTNNLPSEGGFARNAGLAVGTLTTGSQAVLVVKDGGVVSTLFTDIGGSKNGTGRTGLLVVEQGGIFTNLNSTSGFTLGNVNGLGIVTNSGTVSSDYSITIGLGAGGHGVWVHDGGAERPTAKMQHNIYVGDKGLGELIVKSGVFSGGNYSGGYPDYGMIAVGGTNTVTSRIEILDGASLKNGFWYVGGYPGHPKGRGEIVLRGGSLVCGAAMSRKDSLFIGACRDGGAIDGDCFGSIRGWGIVTNVPSVTRYNGIQVLLGNGEIVGDGEGTARTLDCLNFYQVTNALAGVSGNTNGWRAVNKGMVKMPPSYVFGSGTAMSGAKCVGCDMGLARPDLVNAVRVEVTRDGYSGMGCYAHAELYADDRNDIHLNELPGEVAVLGAWRVGVFTEVVPVEENKVLSDLSAKVSFRYDQAKVQKETSDIELLRYVESEGKWTPLAKLTSAQVPADFVIESPAGLGNTGELFNLGLFAVVEKFKTATVIYMR